MIKIKLFKIASCLLITLVIILGITSIKHPIILKCLAGSARLIGKPISARLYTNGHLNNNLQLFYVNRHWDDTNADYYILYIASTTGNNQLKFYSIDKQYNFAGKPVGTGINDYDFIEGYLFQSEVGGHFILFQDDTKGYNFDPKLIFSGKQITLNIPPAAKGLRCDSIRVEL